MTQEVSHMELREFHKEEADQIGWNCTVVGGTVKGDLIVALTPPPHLVSEKTQARTYVYRRNGQTGKYALVQKR